MCCAAVPFCPISVALLRFEGRLERLAGRRGQAKLPALVLFLQIRHKDAFPAIRPFCETAWAGFALERIYGISYHQKGRMWYMKQALIVVDYQNDFVTGSLGFPGAEALDGPICGKIRACDKDADL